MTLDEAIKQGLLLDPDVEDALRNVRVFHGNSYWRFRIDGVLVYLHRWIMQLERGDTQVVDHINRDIDDNRRSNLRIVSQHENTRNSSVRSHSQTGVRGVSLYRNGKYRAYYHDIDGREVHVGYYDTVEEAERELQSHRAA